MTKKKSSTKPKTPFVDISFLFQNRMRSLSADDDQKKKQEILNQLKKACVETGFFTIPIKGILPEDLIKKVSNLP
jgi:isopenicillin N synthase-like dioxygenase